MSGAESILKSISKRFLRDQRGGVALVFALSLIPMVGLSGAAFDYANATSTRGRIGQAADAAALAAAKATNLNAAERARLARQVFDANTANLKMRNVRVKVIDLPSGVRVEANADVSTLFLPVIGINSTNVGVMAEVARNDGYTEVALVLDTTGSMVNDMAGMRTASANFVNTLFSFVNDPTSMRIGVVPYVASVNAGRTNLGMSNVDSTAESPHHAAILKSKWIAWVNNCNPWYNPNPPPPGGGGGGGGSHNPGPGRGTPGRGVWLQDHLKQLGSIGQELFGVKAAAALGETPNTRAPLSGTTYTASPPYTPAPIQALVPTGFTWQSPCRLVNPSRINHLDLFDRIPGAQWAGCVEARPEPFDVTDDPPGSDPRSRFVPYFWPDERGGRSEITGASNNYMDDSPLPANWTFGTNGDNEEKTYSILKYNGANAATLTRDLGPNKACPDELMRLSSDKSALTRKINSLQATFGGGTITSEGAAWGWRVLSHKAPFADGRAPAKNVKKFLVLMSDGENEIGDNPSVDAVVSHYNAYGYLKSGGRFGGENYQVASAYLDNRLRLVCQNAKAAGITIMSVYFRDTNANARALMQNCASENRFFFQAPNTAALNTAFQQIAAEIGKLRITK